MPKVIIPSPLREYVDERYEIQLEGKSLAETIEALISMYPDLRPALLDTLFLSIFINGKKIDVEKEGWDRVIMNEDDEVSLIIPIAGG